MRRLESKILVADARCFEESAVSNDECNLVIRAQRNTFVWYMFPVHIQGKMNEIVMVGKGVRIFEVEKVHDSQHGEQEALGNRSQHCVGHGQRLRYSGKREIHSFNSGLIITCKSTFPESGIVCQQDRRIRSEAVDQ